jgi:hypothetical protein
MTENRSNPLPPLYAQLIQQTQSWALRTGFDPLLARQLRHQAILSNHAHYLEHIPIYRRFAQEEGVGPQTTIETLQRQLMLPDDIFKSYSQTWLDEGNFTRMNAWLGEIFHQTVEVDVGDVTAIDGWIDRLAAHGIRLVYSSGTSGNFSFIPRDRESWNLFTTASSCYIAPLLLQRKAGAWWQRHLLRPAIRLLPPASFAKISRRIGVHDYDAVFLDFASGHTGNQTLVHELAGLFRRVFYLYDTTLSPTVLRLLARGAKNEQDQDALRQLQDLVVTRKVENYTRLVECIRRSTSEGQKIFIFGTTQQYKELCELILAGKQPLALKDGSMILYGGGWKSFTGERISREELLRMMSESLSLPPERILEGYSMTEINAFMLRCDYGRFHIPPTIEPVIFDEQLEPLHGTDMRGVFGFLDALAQAYPGFIISGDEVHFVDGDCPCGLVGPAVTEIGRARAREVKGCGGIMASLKA